MKRIYFTQITLAVIIFGAFPFYKLDAQCQGFSVDITSNPPPPHNLCPGETITLFSNVTGGTPPYTYAWSNGDITPNTVITPPAYGSEMLAVTDDNGCLAENSFHLKASVWTVDIFFNGWTYCVGDSMPLYAYPDFPAGTLFLWSTGATTSSIYITNPGTYSLTATSPTGQCSATATEFVQVSFYPMPNPNITGTTMLCPGQNGTLTASGGAGDLYAWSTGGGTPSISISSPGTYSVTVTNDSGCTGTDSQVVVSGGLPPTLNAPTPICPGQSTTVEVTNAAEFTGFLWSNGETGPSISVNSAGTYTVTVTVAGGCTATGSATVATGSSNINITGTTTPVTSCTTPNGAVNISVSPTGTYEFDWSNGPTTEDLTNIAAGSYTVTATDNGGCTASASFAVANNTTPPVPTATATPDTCSQNLGSINQTVSPAGAYTYVWSNGATTEDLANIAAGSYTVTTTSTTTGCTATASATVTNTTVNLSVTGVITQPSNGQNNGAINVTASPTGVYTYNWSNGATTEDLTGLGEGTYTVTVSAGGNCTATASFVLISAGCPLILTTSVDVPNPGVVCVGDFITISATVTGGTAPYTYAWSNGQTTPSFTVPAPYNETLVLTVTDDDGCTAVTSIHIKVNVWYVDINYSQSPTCAGETLTLIASTTAEIPGTTYTWSTGETGFMINVTSSGTYSVSMTHPSVPCTAEATVTVTIGTAPAPNPQIAGPTTLCPGQTGTLTVNGGPFSTYTWSDGSTDPSLAITDPGGYFVTVTNAEGCTGEDFIEVQAGGAAPILNDPTPICPGQNTTVEVTNPAEFTDFLWSNGGTGPSITVNTPGTYTVTVTAAGGCTAVGSADVLQISSNLSITGVVTNVTSCTTPNGGVDISISPTGTYDFNWSNGPTTEDIANVAAGSYTVTVTESSGCTASQSFAVVENVVLPSLSNIITPATCGQNNGEIDLNASPTGTYTFIWSNGANTEDLVNIAAGSYTVTVTAGGNCTATASFVVEENVSQPSLTATIIPSVCGDPIGAIDLSVAPAGNYVFSWSNGASTEDLTDLLPGNYTVIATVTVTGCTATASYNVPNNSSNFTLTGSPMPVTNCGAPNGQIDLSISPSGAYDFLWSNGEATEDLQDIAAGNYTVTVTQAGACTGEASFQVLSQVVLPLLVQNSSPASCGQPNGSVDLSVTPASGNSFSWSIGASSEDLQNVPSGSYAVTVTSANGCTATTLATVLENTSVITLTGATTANTSCTAVNGSVDLTALPSSTYNFVWSNGANSEDLQNLAAGNYSVTVSAGGNCTTTAVFTVPNNSGAPTISPISSPSNCGQNDGAIDITIYPSGVYVFSWSNGETTEDLQNLAPGTYTVTCTGANGCTATLPVEVPSGSATMSLSTMPTANMSCTSPSGAVDLTVFTIGTYTCVWSNGATTEDLQNLPSGSYAVTVTDALGCTETATAMVGGPAQPQVTVTGPASACTGQSATLTAGPGFSTYLWSNGSTINNISVSQTGTYSVTATDANGCTATDGQPFQSLPLPVPSINGPAAICGGSTQFTVSGGIFSQINWSTGEDTSNITVSHTGVYTVTVSNSDGCTATASQSLDVGTSLLPAIATDTANCGGTATLDAGSGYASYLWSDGSTGQFLLVNADGAFAVTVSDGTGCTGEAAVAVSIPVPPQVAITGNSSICSGSSTQFSVPNIFTQIIWSTGANTNTITVSQPTVYGVTVTDANGCTATDSQTLTVGAGLTPDITTTLANCDGSTTLDAVGSFSSYLWSNGSTGPSITVSTNGSYDVTVSDASGCTGTASENVVLPQPPTVTISGANDLCNGDETVLVAPGNFAQYLWNTGEATSEITISQGGEYSVTVSDANGCTASASWTVAQLQTSYTLLEASACSPQDTGMVQTVLSNQLGCDSVVVVVTILSQPIFTQVQMNTCEGESVIFNGVDILAGNSQDFVFASASGGCDSTVSVSVAAFPVVDFELAATRACHSAPDGAISVTVSGGQFPYLYSLNGGVPQNGPVFINLTGGAYTVLVEDANGCSFMQNIEVPESVPIELLVEDEVLPCGEEGITLRPLVVSGSPSSLEWAWEDGSQKPWLNVNEAGTYKVVVDDGCGAIERSIDVMWDDEYRRTEFFYIPNCFSPNGDGINDVFQVFPGRDFEILSFEFRVFDRWGDAMFTTFDPAVGWDGVFREVQKQPEVLVWFVKAQVLVCGSQVVDVFREGGVTIVR